MLYREFQQFYKNVKEFREYLRKNRFNNDSYIKLTLHSLKNGLVKFTELYTQQNREAFIQTFPMELYLIHDTLIGKDDKKLNGKFRSLHDAFFKTCLGIVHVQKRLSFLPTLLFNKFIKDTTRELSCGAQDVTSQYKFINAMNILRERVLIKMFERTCYIERLIFDDIHNNAFHQQDLGQHKQFKLKYDDDNYPQMLIITDKTHELITDETYTISRMHDRVMCVRTTRSKDGITRYEKVQTFKQEEPWILQTTP
jgi:hypothetical protein